MMFSSIFTLASLAAAAPVCKQRPTYGLVTINSGSELQYQTVKLASDGHLSLNGETDVTFQFKDDALYANGKGVELFEGFPIVKSDGTYGLTWGQKDGDLTFSDSNLFTVCLDNNRNIAFSGEGGAPTTCSNPVSVSLKLVEQ